MAVSMKELGIEQLSANDKMALAEELIDSISEVDRTIDIPEWHWEIIEARLKEAEENPGLGTSWDDLRKELRSKGPKT